MLRARIASVEAGPLLSTEGGAARPSVEAEVLETLKGAEPGRRIRFAQHGHGVARFEPGDETLLFLIDIARSRELDVLGELGSHEWVSLQEHEDEYPLVPGTRQHLMAAVEAYLEAGRAGAPEARSAALRRGTLALLTSRDPDLAASALRDLVIAPELPLLTARDVPALRALLEDPGVAMGVRVGLLAELERRKLVDGPPLWLELLAADAAPRDRATAIRAAAASSDRRVRARLVALVSDPDPTVAATAATALGQPGNREAVAALSEALSRDSKRVRMSAIRGLGRIGLPEAERALEIASATHPDPETRRRARAEIRKRRASARE